MLVRDLRDLGAGAELGGKAAGLARLIAAGARVPPGFAIAPRTTWDEEADAALLEAAGALLAGGPVAVRSSAVGEDSAEKSYAGLFETVLGVSGPEELAAAARRCVSSGAAERVLAYAGRTEPVPVGVVVQRMVTARAAGVCFTRDPSGRDGAVVLEAVKGTGDALVSGRANPERWRVYWNGLGKLESRCRGECGALARDEAEGIAEQSAALARTFGFPLDLEWAIDADGTLFWLQARPVTAVAGVRLPEIERAYGGADDGPVTVWANWNVRETLPDPLTPLAWGIWREQILPMLGAQLLGLTVGSPLARQLHAVDLVNGRIYFNMNAFLALPVLGPLSRRILHVVDARVGRPLEGLEREGILVPRRLASRRGLGLRFAWAGVAGLGRMSRGLFPRRAFAALHEEAMEVDRRPAVATLGNEELLAELGLWLSPACARLRDGLQMEGMAMLVYALAGHAFRRHPRARALLATGIPANPTTQISIGVDDLVEKARPLSAHLLGPLGTRELLDVLGAEPEGRAFREALDAFLARFGHRGPMEFDMGATRWGEDPTMILDLVRAGLRAGGGEGVRARLERLGRERAEEIAKAVRAEPSWKRPLLRFLARQVELYMPLREAPKHYGLFVFRRLRQAAFELGARLARRGALPDAGDVFFLELAELELLARGGEAPADLPARLAARRARQERFRDDPAPEIVRSDGVPVLEEERVEADGVLRGSAVSAGTAEGPVLVLRDPDPSRLTPGDVLVVSFADPGWTPLFARASAVVMEVGGTMCHAAVVAREMGIPAVFAARGATTLLADGERVVVDGTKGTVTRVAGRG